MKENKKNKFDGATFIIDIKSKENHSWQGKLTWVETTKVVNFRSALELIKIIDSALPGEEDDEVL